MDIQVGSRVAIASGKNAGLEYEVLSIEGDKAVVRSLRTNATGTAHLNNLIPVGYSITLQSIDAHLSTIPVDSPADSPATGENVNDALTPDTAKLSLSTGDTSGVCSADVPDKFSGYRGKLVSLIDAAIALLEPRALLGAWIATRTKGDRTYYALRRMNSNGTEQSEQPLKFGEIEPYRRRCNEGKILVRLRELRSLLLADAEL